MATIRKAFEEYLIRSTKRKAPAIYPEDFVVFFNSAVRDICGLMYNEYEKTQMLSDDLSSLAKHVVIDIDDDIPFPLNIHYIDGTAFVSFHHTYEMISAPSVFPIAVVPGINGTSTVRRQSINDISILKNSRFTVSNLLPTTAILDQLIFNRIDEGTIIAIADNCIVRDYRYDGNTNNYQFGFNLFDQPSSIQVTPTSPLHFIYNSNTGMYDLIYGKGYSYIDEQRLSIHSPNDYWHLTGMMNRIDYKKKIECDKVFKLNIGGKRLTDEVRASIYTNKNVYLKPSVKRRNNYYHELNNINSIYPDFEVLYCDESEINLVELRQIEFLYLKEPKIYELEDVDIDGNDNTESIEFPNSVYDKILEQTELLILEKTSNPRVKTQPLVNGISEITRAK